MGKTWMAVALVVIASISNSQIDEAKVVATVNGEAIKGGDYYRRMEFLPGVGKRVGENLLESPPGFLTIVQLVFEKLVLQLAKEKGVLPTKAEIDLELKSRLEDDPRIVERWSQGGRTQAELEESFRFELAQFKIQTFGINITDLEVDKFYKENPSSFTSSKAVKIRVIAVQSAQDSAAVEADLAAGKPFEEVAKARSLDVTRGIGGLLGTVPVSYLPESVRTPINALKIGQATDWLSVGPNKVKYLLVDVVPEKLQTLTPLLRRVTRRKLMLDRGRVKNNLMKEIEAMRAKAKVVITNKEFATMYERMTTPVAGP